MAQFDLYRVNMKVVSGICSGIAIISTLARIYIRLRSRIFWIDDALAIFSACLSLAQTTVVFIDPYYLNGVERYYMISFTWLAIIWSARLSILLSLIRIAKGTIRPTMNLHIATGIFLIAYTFLTAQLAWECETKVAWKEFEQARCPISRAVPACQLVADIVSDGILILIPIHLVRVIQDRGLRHRLMLIFGTSIITTLTSLPHSAFSFVLATYPALITALVENAVSLIVCNIPVLVAATINLKRSEDLPSSPNDLPSFRGISFRTLEPVTEQGTTEMQYPPNGDIESQDESIPY